MMKKGPKKTEIGLWTAVIITGAVLFLVFHVFLKEGNQVVIRVSGKVVKICPLYENDDFEIEGKNGGKNQVVIQNGSVWIEEADCPDLLCVRQSAIRKSKESIICLPNEVVVEIENQEEGDTADVIAK